MNWHSRFVQQARWTDELRGYLFKRIGLDTTQRILEVGCGTGAVLSDFSHLFSITKDEEEAKTGGIHGLDINPDFLSQAANNTPFAQLTLGDAHMLPYATSSFDQVFCHFLLLWVDDPVHSVVEMIRVTRSGGYVLALAEPDYGGRIDYPTTLIELGILQETALNHQGAETRVGRRLGSIFHQGSLSQIEIGLLGGHWRISPQVNDSNWDLEWQVLEFDLHESLQADELSRYRAIEEEARQHGERLLFVPTFYAIGLKK